MYTFEEILGNQQILKNLRSAISSGKLSHAYLITGGEGMGKKTLARTFAKAMQCSNKGERPCGKCTSCHVFDSNNHPDVIYVRPQKTKALSVDDIREQVNEQIGIKQYHYQYKIFLIENADTMTVQAQNALLKTLEEPPYYGIFLLAASNIDRFLPTILSRCVILKMRGLSTQDIRFYLENKEKIDKEKAEVLAEYAQGSLGRALKMANSEEFTAMREEIFRCLSKIHSSDLVSVMAMAKDLEPYKDIPEMLDFIYLWYRDILVMKRQKDIHYLIQKDKQQEIQKQAEQETFEGLSKKLKAVWDAKRSLNQNSNFQLTLEVMLIKLKES